MAQALAAKGRARDLEQRRETLPRVSRLELESAWLVDRAITPSALTVEKVQALLAQHDPKGQARGISYRSYDGTLTSGDFPTRVHPDTNLPRTPHS